MPFLKSVMENYFGGRYLSSVNAYLTNNVNSSSKLGLHINVTVFGKTDWFMRKSIIAYTLNSHSSTNEASGKKEQRNVCYSKMELRICSNNWMMVSSLNTQ